MLKRSLILTTLITLVTGCSSTPVQYNEHDSYALNVARAANIDAKLKDTKLPKDTVTNITDSAGFGFAYAASGYNAPVAGFSSSQMAGMNFAAWLLAPEADSARNSLIAWMPEELATESPIDALADLLLEGASQGIRDIGFTPVQVIAKGGTDKSGISIYLTGRNDGVCQDNEYGRSNCRISFALRDPTRTPAPNVFPEQQGRTWFFDPSVNVYSRFVFPKENLGFDELELLVATSKHLPEWVYFYVAPKKVFIGKDQPIKVPLIIRQGRIHYFIKADAMKSLAADQGR